MAVAVEPSAGTGEQPSASELVGDVERGLEQLEALPDPVARATALSVVQALLDLYGAGLERIVEEVAARDLDGSAAEALTGDELVSHLLLLHGLHPVAVEERVRGALASVRPYLESHGGDVSLLAVEDGVVRLRLVGSCSGCPSSTMTLKLAIENAIHRAAPEIEEVVAVDEPPAAGSALLQIEVMGARAGGAAGQWTIAGSLPDLPENGSRIRPVSGRPVVFVRLGGRLYAYRPACPGCGASVGEGAVREGALACSGCGERFDVLRAGRGLDSPQLHLEPVPLLVGEDGLVRVALAVAA